MISRIRNWWRGYYRPHFSGAVDEPPICQCGHYLHVHGTHSCGGWAYDQWARIGRLSWDLRCRCRVTP